MHEFNEETGLCDWTGPKDACLQLVGYWKRSWFMPLPNFPQNYFNEVDLKATGNLMDDYAMKVVVRRGCMFTGYAYPVSMDAWTEVKVGENLIYGAHDLPNYMRGNYSQYTEGLTRVHCFCDPTEATVGGHVPAPPADRKCAEYHAFNETTEQCEWQKDPKFCAEIITSDNRRKMLEIPNWPDKRKYDGDHWNRMTWENFHHTVTNIIVRQHCFATIFWNIYHPWKTMPTRGYGHHTVASKNNGLAGFNHAYAGSGWFICECIR